MITESAAYRKLEEDEMSNFGQRQPDDTSEAPRPSDSLKPHSDKMPGTMKGVAGGSPSPYWWKFE